MSQRAYDQIPIPGELDEAVKRGIEEGKRLRKISRRRRRLAGFGSAAAVVAIAAGVCWSNPSLAGKIPLIGHIFQRVEQSIPYPGDYSQKAGVLKETEGQEETKEGNAAKNMETQEKEQIYTASDQGMTLTASEVYWNSSQINVSIALEYEKLGVMGFYENGYQRQSYDTVQMMGKLLLNGKEVGTELALEGQQTDEHTFAGVGRISLDQWDAEEAENLELEIFIDQIWWNDVSKAYQGQEGASQYSSARYCDGDWTLKIPVSDAAEEDLDVREIPVQKTNEEGFGFGAVTVTDYEISVEMICPDLDEQEREAFYEGVRAKAEEALGQEEAERFYADAWLEPEDGLHCGVAAFDQDGNRIENVSESSFQVEGKTITKISLYLLADDVTAIKADDLEQIRACAIYETEVAL